MKNEYNTDLDLYLEDKAKQSKHIRMNLNFVFDIT